MAQPTTPDQLPAIQEEYAQTGRILSGGAVWLLSQVTVLRERVEHLTATTWVEAADLAENHRQFEPCTGPRKDAQISENVGILRAATALRAKADELAPATVEPTP